MEQALPNDLLESLIATLEHDTRINMHRWPISIGFENGKVVLTGQVENITMKRAASNTATRLLGDDYPVLDRLRIMPAETKEGLELRDEVIRTLSTESVFGEYTLYVTAGEHRETVHDAGPEAYNITASIDSGTITLSGRVGSLSHKRLAEVLVWWTSGCELVINCLEVVPPEEDSDNEITDVVRMVLEKDPLVHADLLRIGIAAGVVTLYGSLASEEEKRLALRDAWYVPGVWDVVDNIQARS